MIFDTFSPFVRKRIDVTPEKKKKKKKQGLVSH